MMATHNTGSTIADRIERDFARIDEIVALYDRLKRARNLGGGIYVNEDGSYTVEGETGVYDIVNGVCSCPDAKYRAHIHGGRCKHRIAVELTLAKAS